MPIVYDKLFALLESKGIRKYNFRNYFDVSGSSFEQLRKNKTISTKTLSIICATLECKIEDICEYVYSDEESRNITTIDKMLLKKTNKKNDD